VQANDRENETQAQHQDDNGVDAQTGALIGVQLQHRAGRTTRASGASRAGANIPQRLLVVCSRATAHSGARTTGGSRRRRTADGRAGGGSTGAGARGLGVRA
jgi:hypothetical protein